MARPKEGALLDPLISHQNTWSVNLFFRKLGRRRQNKVMAGTAKAERNFWRKATVLYQKQKKEIRYVRTQTTSFLLLDCVSS